MSQATSAPVVVSEMQGKVKWIRFNRPEVKNAITPETADRMREQVESAPREDARVIVITGSSG